MKKDDKKILKKTIKYTFIFLFVILLTLYFSMISGYYEYINHEKMVLTEEQIKKFESDVASGKEVDITDYLTIEDREYNNNLSNISSSLSNGISNLITSGVDKTFKFLSKLVDS